MTPSTPVERLAELLVGRSLGVQPGWQVMVVATPLARPLVESVTRSIARRGAYPLVRLSFTERERVPLEGVWAAEAPLELLSALAPSEERTLAEIDAYLIVFSPENVNDAGRLPTERRRALGLAHRAFSRRTAGDGVAWVSVPYPTQALAQEAGLPLGEYEDILYAACLRDWDNEHARMRRYADRFDAASEVRIVGPGTDLSLSLAGRLAEIDDAHRNMPGGEFFYSPLESSAEGVIEFSEFSAAHGGHRCEGIRLRFKQGVVADASARQGEEYLLGVLDTDEGARRLGELGIGCNTGLPRHVHHMWFDEKVAGTIHLALGQGFPSIGGTNESTIHWDLVKDLSDGYIELDGVKVQEAGNWLL
jgi:aminopeptidase